MACARPCVGTDVVGIQEILKDGFNGYLVQPGSEVRSRTYGVLALTLRPGAYDWQFTPVAGKTFTDSGSSPCH